MRILLLFVALVFAGDLPDPATAPIASLSEHPGRLRNAAQQALYRREVQAATDLMARTLAIEPYDGFTHGQLAQTLAYGWNLGPEVAAAYAAVAAQDHEHPQLVAFAALAAREAHREDRFLGPESPWFAQQLRNLDHAAIDAPIDAQAELLLARRSLLSLVKQHDEARAAGIAAHALRPGGLQGRLTRMIQARIDGDIDSAKAGCLRILKTDPWAAEACSTLWAAKPRDEGPTKEQIDAAKAEVLTAMAALEDRWIADPVVANELMKFRARIKDNEGQNALRGRAEEATPGFRYLNRTRWWRSGTVIAQPYRSMNVATTKSRELPPNERLAALMGHWEAVPEEGADDWGLTRYLKAVADTAAELGDRPTTQKALDALVTSRPADPDALLRLARHHAEDPKQKKEAIRLVRRSAEALLAEPWEPMAAAQRRKRFTDHVAALRSGLAVRRELESTLTAPTIDPDQVPNKPSAWFTWADAQTDPVLALHGSLEALSLLAVGDRLRLPPELLAPSVQRFTAALPIFEPLGLDPTAALLAAAQERARVREQRKETGGKEQHPLVGHPAPTFAVETMAGASLTNDNQRGRVVIVDFWATWCGPCIKELPHLAGIKERLGDAPVTWLMASVDGGEDVVAPFMKKRGFDFDPAWVGEVGMKQRWQVRGIPSLFVVDREGTVRHHHQGYRPDIAEVLEGEIRALLSDR